jgi:uncharacterized protein (TIGR03435 family)
MMRMPLLLAATALAAAAQTQPAFEAATVKLNKTPDRRNVRLEMQPSGRVNIVNIPLHMIVALTYNVPFQSQVERLSGGPAWVRSETYDIQATAGAFPPDMTARERQEKMKLMLRTLLAERFRMKITHESKEMPVYTLTVAKGGPKVKSAGVTEEDCAAGKQVEPPCHEFFGGMGRGIHAKAVEIAEMARFIENWSDRPVLDRTGLHGLFEMDTDGWVPMIATPAIPGTPPSAEATALADPARPTLFIVMERLGLKLAPDRGPVDIYRIESAERPGEN